MKKSKSKSNSRVSQLDNKAIKIRVPAGVAFDIERMKEVTNKVLTELGCPACHSGFDLRFDIEREFVFNEKLDIIRKF